MKKIEGEGELLERKKKKRRMKRRMMKKFHSILVVWECIARRRDVEILEVRSVSLTILLAQ
jgi:hypothetical protein